MNKGWILFHPRETQEELTRTIATIDAGPAVDEIELQVAMAHMYHRLNTACNSRAESDEEIAVFSEDNFYNWRAFPKDMLMGE